MKYITFLVLPTTGGASGALIYICSFVIPSQSCPNPAGVSKPNVTFKPVYPPHPPNILVKMTNIGDSL